jgi:predicted ribosomally synthesized peptide with nif11-like leader
MSKMQEFYQKVSKDLTLQDKFNQIMESAEKDGAETTEQKLLQYAKAAGYEIEIVEMQAFFEGMVTQASGELSDAELDQVAGGKSTTGGWVVVASVVTLGTFCAIGSLVAELSEGQGQCAKGFE